MLYDNVKRLCEKRQVSVGQIEKAVGFSNGSICKWNDNAPSVYKVQRVAGYLGVTVDSLLEDEEKDVRR